MNFLKKVIVIKQIEKGYSLFDKTVSGIARIEVENGEADFSLSIINLALPPSGNYSVFLLDGKGELFSFEFGARPDFLVKKFSSVPDLSKLSVGIVFIDNCIPLTVAFGTTENENFELSLSRFNKLIAEHYCKIYNNEQKNLQTIPEKEMIYNDEAVATENYFSFDEIEEKLECIKERDNEKLSNENELPAYRSKEKEKKSDENCDGAQNEAGFDRGKKYSASNPYYLSVQGELDEIFDKFPEEKELQKTFHKSRWAKVFYSDTKYYVVGLVFEDDKEKYICYGVPATYSKEPPKELKGFCSFIPLSIFSLLGDGYWMMFQDAVTGECIKPK